MVENKKKKNYIFTIIITLLFITFISLYFSQINGYYEYTQYNKKTITEDAMKQFEKDVAEGKDIQIEDYLKDVYKDYSNGMSSLGLKTSATIENFMTKGIKRIFKIFSALFVE